MGTTTYSDGKTGERKEYKDYSGEHAWYLALFDRVGKCKNAIKIDVPGFTPKGAAVFDSGEFLVIGFDTRTDSGKIALLSSTGAFVRFFNPPTPLPMSLKLVPSPPGDKSADELPGGDARKAAFAISGYQLTHHGDAILLMQPGSDGPIFEAHSSGSMRTIDLQIPEKFLLDSLVPSDHNLYIRYRREGTNDGRGEDGLIYEVDPYSGLSIKKISVDAVTMWDVMCVHEGKFKAIGPAKNDNDGVFMTGELQPLIAR